MPIRDRVKELKRVRASELIPHPLNPRRHPDYQRDAMRGVLQEIGYADALIVREDNGAFQIIDGHLRAEITPDQLVPVLVVDLTPEEAEYELATHDPLGAMARNDQDALMELLQRVQTDDKAVAAMLEAVANGETAPLLTPDVSDEEDEQATADKLDQAEAEEYVPFTERGQVWRLGDHRLMCGDATKEGDHDVLLNGAGVDLVLTDPPYGVGVEYEDFEDSRDNVKALITATMPFLRRWPCVLLTPGQRWLWDYPRPTWMLGWVHPAGNGLNPWGFTLLHPILAYGPDPYLAKGRGSRPDTLVLAAGREGLTSHPAAKPLAVWEWMLERGSANQNEAILDPFLGSGTTIIAAEKLNRRCYAMEIEPRYCDVAIRRWEEYTGRKAELPHA